MRSVPLAAVLAAALAVPGMSASAVAPKPQAVFVFDGRGHGHGVGMAQDSAYAMAESGLNRERILQHFYPGTARGSRSGLIRVMVWETGASTGNVTVAVPSGARVSDGSKAADAPAGAVLQVSYDASGYHVRSAESAPGNRGEVMRAGLLEPTPSSSPTNDPLPVLPSTPASPSASPSPKPASPTPAPASASPAPAPRLSPTRAASAAPSPSPTPFGFDSTSPVTLTPTGGGLTQVVSTGRSYRGQMLAMAGGGFRLVDVLDIEEYLRGLGEVPHSWPDAALQTQAVAARTYALRAREAGHPLGYDLCDDTRCQVYVGVQSESSRSTAAARDTAGEVITYRGSLAEAFYSANAGGFTASPAEGFGYGTVISYLPSAVTAPGDRAVWKVTATPADVAARLGYPGRLDAVTVAQRGLSGRALSLRLDGSAGARTTPAVKAASRLGLWSTLFTVQRSTGVPAALPAPATAAIQLPPALAAEQLPPAVAAEPSAAPSPATAALSPRGEQRPDGAVVLLAWLLLIAAAVGVALAVRAQRSAPPPGPSRVGPASR